MNKKICMECGKTFDTKQGIGNHIGFKHNKKKYYDKYIKNGNEDLCFICGQPTKFRGLYWGYKQTCENKECISINYSNKLYIAIKEKYGVENVAYIPGVQEKKRETCLKKYGVEVSSQSEEVKEKVR